MSLCFSLFYLIDIIKDTKNGQMAAVCLLYEKFLMNGLQSE